MSVDKTQAGNSLIFNLIKNNNIDAIIPLLHAFSISKDEEFFPMQQKNKNGLTPLLYALKNKRYDIVKLFLDTPFSSKLSLISLKTTAFHIAIRNKAPIDILIQLSLYKPKIDSIINFRDINGLTALLLAFKVYYDSLTELMPVVDFLLDNGADVSIPDYDNKTPLHYAIQYNTHSLIERLATPTTINAKAVMLFKGIDYILQCGDAYTPLHLAVIKGHVRIIEKLIEMGANPAIDLIANIHYLTFIAKTRKKAVKLWNSLSAGKETSIAFMHTKKHENYFYLENELITHKSNASLLIEFRKRITNTDRDEMTYTYNLLHMAIILQRVEVISYLLDNNIFDPNTPVIATALSGFHAKSSCISPLSIACSIENMKVKEGIINLLLNSGANVDQPIVLQEKSVLYLKSHRPGREVNSFSNLLRVAIESHWIPIAKLAFDYGGKEDWMPFWQMKLEMKNFLSFMRKLKGLDKTILSLLIAVADGNKKKIANSIKEVKIELTALFLEPSSQLYTSYIIDLLTYINLDKLLSTTSEMNRSKITSLAQSNEINIRGLLPLLKCLQINIEEFFSFIKPEYNEQLSFDLFYALADGLVTNLSPLHQVSTTHLLQLKEHCHQIEQEVDSKKSLDLRIMATDLIRLIKEETVSDFIPLNLSEIKSIIKVFESQLQQNYKTYSDKILGLHYLIEAVKLTTNSEITFSLRELATHVIGELESYLQIEAEVLIMPSLEPLTLETIILKTENIQQLYKESELSFQVADFDIEIEKEATFRESKTEHTKSLVQTFLGFFNNRRHKSETVEEKLSTLVAKDTQLDM